MLLAAVTLTAVTLADVSLAAATLAAVTLAAATLAAVTLAAVTRCSNRPGRLKSILFDRIVFEKQYFQSRLVPDSCSN